MREICCDRINITLACLVKWSSVAVIARGMLQMKIYFSLTKHNCYYTCRTLIVKSFNNIVCCTCKN